MVGMDESLRIRPVAPADAEQLGDLFAEFAADPGSAHFHPHPFTPAMARRIAERDGIVKDQYFVAMLDGRVAGYGMLRGWDEGYEIPSFGVGVAITDRGRGIGRRLLRYAISTARERGARTLMLKVHPSNVNARHIYETEGFTFDPVPGDGGQVRGELPL
jgi:ribosomal-protein-alanine N-acetyltransferase